VSFFFDMQLDVNSKVFVFLAFLLYFTRKEGRKDRLMVSVCQCLPPHQLVVLGGRVWMLDM
jgi:hypothetical protein